MRTKLVPTTTSGNRKSWFKKITAVDQDCKNGYAFAGEFIPDGVEVDLSKGDVVIECRPEGSVKNGHKEGFAYPASFFVILLYILFFIYLIIFGGQN